jgi:hypothetical protein
MSETLLTEFERFFEELPASVRKDLSFTMIMLSDEDRTADEFEPADDNAARALFAARTHIGRIANLVRAASIFDIYFAMSARKRFGAAAGANKSHLLDRYAAQIADIQAAKRRWTELRRTIFSPAAIAAALDPPKTTRRRVQLPSQPSSTQESKLQELDMPFDAT